MNIVVLAGGTSTEREISIVSGSGLCRALRKNGHHAVLVDAFIGLERVDWTDPFPDDYDVEAAAAYMKEASARVPGLVKSRKSFWGPGVLKLCDLADFVYLGLHGMNGEDGRVQATFDLMGIRYTGSGYLGSGLAMDKGLTKTLFRFGGVCTPEGRAYTRQTVPSKLEDTGLDFPVVVKTCCGGSSVGVYIVRDQEAYTQALEKAFSYENQVVIEAYIQGRELTVSVVNREAWPIVEIEPRQGFYDYRNKYEPGATVETCPAALSAEKTREIQEMAVTAAGLLGLDEYCRLDFMMDASGTVYCLEANTLPGMTPTSLIPQEAAALGIDYPQLCEKLLRISMKKYE